MQWNVFYSHIKRDYHIIFQIQGKMALFKYFLYDKIIADFICTFHHGDEPALKNQ